MAVSPEYLGFVQDQLAGLPATARRMFGGVALYAGAAMFGFVYEDRLYFKAGAANAGDYDRAGMPALVYAPHKTAQVVASLREVPPDVAEDADELVAWARRAGEAARSAALRSAASRPRRRSPSRRQGDGRRASP